MKKVSWVCGLVLCLALGFGPFLGGSYGTMRMLADGIVFPDGTKQTTAATGNGPPVAGAPVPKTGQTTSYRTGDDGNLQKGVAWPNPRFTDHGNGTVTDNLTGLMWVKAPHALPGNSGTRNWYTAIDFCNALTHAGYSDWYLPNKRQLISLTDDGQSYPALPLGHPFTGVQSVSYWSSTTDAYDHSFAWFVSLGFGFVSYDDKNVTHYVWPARSGQ